MSERRAVCLNCMDGRTQLPVIQWIMKNYQIDFVDMVTEAGMDGFLADQNSPMGEIHRMVNISTNINKALMIFVVGHFDCRGNPVDEITHRTQIAAGVKRIQNDYPDKDVIGAWVNDQWKVEKL